MKQPPQPNCTKAWVVFSGRADLAWLRLLRPGFRHCFAILHDGCNWISFDPLSNYTDVTALHLPCDFDLPGWLAARGYRVVRAPVDRHVAKPAPVMVFNCVEAVKRLLGLHKRSIITPWQLYRYLTRIAGKCRLTAAFNANR
jgi:hypothetical protein